MHLCHPVKNLDPSCPRVYQQCQNLIMFSFCDSRILNICNRVILVVEELHQIQHNFVKLVVVK